ncbi:MAG TPA: hypothetical protein VMO26_18265 [Vicinamibacterales bacterium]|nr:hypothetical protein [Vicinamibacterales bacterium]
MKQAILTVCLCLGVAASVAAQQRPLLTEDPETIGGGRLLIEAGVDVERDVFYPASGLRGDRLAVPSFGISIGLSSIAELQIDGGFYQRLRIVERRSAPLSGVLDFDGDETTDVEDFVVATKLRLWTEGTVRPAIGLRLATRLPNSSNESGLGTDMTDFFASMLFAKTVESVRIVGNGGLAIVGDPTASVPEQTDMFTFGLSVARAMTDRAELVGEVHGRLNFTNGTPDPGAENRAVMRLGGRYTRGPVRVDGAVLLGMTSRDPGFGFTTGFTWVLNAFQVP